MATLIELAEGYTEAIVKIKIAIADLEDALAAAPARERDALRVQLEMLRTIHRELREVRRVCLTYYTKDRDPRYCYRTGG